VSAADERGERGLKNAVIYLHNAIDAILLAVEAAGAGVIAPRAIADARSALKSCERIIQRWLDEDTTPPAPGGVS
jgi:hypothetical protein